MNSLRNQENPLLQLQTKEYINFIKYFTDSTNILNKNFYVVITYSPATQLRGIGSLFASKKDDFEKEESNFEENRFQLQQRADYVASGLNSIGVKSSKLETAELVELFYKTFNPGETEAPKIE